MEYFVSERKVRVQRELNEHEAKLHLYIVSLSQVDGECTRILISGTYLREAWDLPDCIRPFGSAHLGGCAARCVKQDLAIASPVAFGEGIASRFAGYESSNRPWETRGELSDNIGERVMVWWLANGRVE